MWVGSSSSFDFDFDFHCILEKAIAADAIQPSCRCRLGRVLGKGSCPVDAFVLAICGLWVKLSREGPSVTRGNRPSSVTL